MSLARRAQQWASMARIWHIYDAKWQDPFFSAMHLKKYLMGMYKPLYHPMNDCGDHVVVINSRHIALSGDEWRKRVYYHATGYAKGVTWTLAWEVHNKDPRLIIKKALYSSMESNLQRRHTMRRLHIFPDEDVPKEILQNVTNQIKQLRPIPRRYEDIPKEEKDNFPEIITFPDDYSKQFYE